eukprot:251152-Chlamydomonas_euryale.AAC.2
MLAHLHARMRPCTHAHTLARSRARTHTLARTHARTHAPASEAPAARPARCGSRPRAWPTPLPPIPQSCAAAAAGCQCRQLAAATPRKRASRASPQCAAPPVAPAAARPQMSCRAGPAAPARRCGASRSAPPAWRTEPPGSLPAAPTAQSAPRSRGNPTACRWSSTWAPEAPPAPAPAQPAPRP